MKLLKPSLHAPDSGSPQPGKKAKVEHGEVNPKMKPNELLNKADEKLLLDGKWLSDIHINLAKQLFIKQFLQVSGLCSTCYFCKQNNLFQLAQVLCKSSIPEATTGLLPQ